MYGLTIKSQNHFTTYFSIFHVMLTKRKNIPFIAQNNKNTFNIFLLIFTNYSLYNLLNIFHETAPANIAHIGRQRFGESSDSKQNQ